MQLAGRLFITALSCFVLCTTGRTEPVGGFTDFSLHPSSLAWLNDLQAKQGATNNLVWLLYKLAKSQNEMIQRERSDEEDEGKNRRDTEADRLLASRVRGEGCRIFFWKSWTSC
ncbi:somatostatin-1A-like [Lampris incognitus]|uniref:somatostatin-1A-like n=1 Tax=Lampris incognitus TaxID=2546036 RepID=UPI0024B591D4|nr:somatostatin-1A-like [Lampris incognitus]